MSLTHFAPATSLLWKYLESVDINPEPLYKKADINPELLLNPNARISISRVDALWEQAAGVIEDPCFAIDMAEFRRFVCGQSNTYAVTCQVYVIVLTS